MLDQEEIIEPVRNFITCVGVTDPEAQLLAEVSEGSPFNVAKFLPRASSFIALEKDEAIHIEPVIDRLDALAAAVPNLSFEGGTAEQRQLLVTELQKPVSENVLALAVEQLQTIVQDLRFQIRGSVTEVNTDGFERDPGDESSADSSKMPRDDSGSDHNSPADDKRPSTWHDSAQRQDGDDFDQAPKTDDWKQSLDNQMFDSGVDDSWRTSISDGSSVGDDYIANLAQTSFDRDVEGDVHGYHRSLTEKLVLAEGYLAEMKKVFTYFVETLRPALGCAES